MSNTIRNTFGALALIALVGGVAAAGGAIAKPAPTPAAKVEACIKNSKGKAKSSGAEVAWKCSTCCRRVGLTYRCGCC